MMLVSGEAEMLAKRRFFSAQDGRLPSESSRLAMMHISDAVRSLGAIILDVVPDGRNKALALTALEEVQMRANRAFFDLAG